MRKKNLILLTLAFLMMSVVAFAQPTEQTAQSGQKKLLTLKQQLLQAKREGQQLNKEAIAQFKYNKPATSKLMKKQKRNVNLPIKKLDATMAKTKASFLQVPGKAKAPRKAGIQSYEYHFISSMNGWTEIDADGDGYSWTILITEQNPGHGGEAGCMTSESYQSSVGALSPDNYLVSPKMKLDGKITFWACGQDASYPAEHFGVAVSTASGTDPDDFTTIQEWTMTAAPSLAPSANFNAPAGAFRSPQRVQGNWYEYTYDLSAYAGAEGYVAIRHFGCTDMFRLNVDDITLETSELLDPYDPTLEVMPELVELPTGATVTPYYTIDGTLAVNTSSGWADYTSKVKNINVAFVGSDVYIQGLAYWQSDYWVKGTLSGNVITVPSGQYVGDGEYLNGMTSNGTWLENYTFTVDTEAGTITCDGYIGESESPTVNSLYSYWITPVFSLTEPDNGTVTPPSGLVTQTWTFAGYFYDGEDDTPTEKPLQIGFDGNDVYVQGIGNYMPEAWIKGTLSADGNSITFASGQYYGAYDDTYDLWFAVGDEDFNYLESVTVAYDAVAGTITWPEDIYIFENGAADEISAYGLYYDILIVRGSAPDPLVAPSGLETTEWLFKSQCLTSDEETGETAIVDYNLHVQVGFDGSDVWVQGLCEDLPETWIKGTMSGNTVTFPTGQHFGTYTFLFWDFDYFFVGYGDGNEDVVMTYDAGAKTMTMESPNFMLINAYWLLLDPNLILMDASLSEIPDVAATPAQPTITGSNFTGSYPNVTVDIPVEDAEGNAIQSSKLSYQYYYKVGNTVTPLTLTTDLYTELTADMTEIPYPFTDDWDVYNYRLYLNMDFTGWDQIGIQSIYRGGGEEKKSDIFWYDIYQPQDVTLTLEPGADIAQALNDKADEMRTTFTKPGNVTINMADGDYTVTSPIMACGDLTISGNDVNVDASGLTGPFIVLDGTNNLAPKADGTNSDHQLISTVSVKGLTISGLTDAFIKDNQKTLLEQLIVDDCVIEMPASSKNFIDFNGKGYIGEVKVKNSTIWASGKNTGFFAQYGSRPKNVNGNLEQVFDIRNSDIINIANGKNVCDLKQNGTAQNVYTLKDNIFVDCGKNGQTVVGFNKGQPSPTPQWDVTGNYFEWGGACTNDAEISKAGQKNGEDIVKDCVYGDPEFADAANGDFTLGETSELLHSRTGDPRWFGNNLQPIGGGQATDPIEVVPVTKSDPANPIDLSLLLKGELEFSPNPASITFKLRPDEHYIVSEPLTVGTRITIMTDGEDPANIDCSMLNGPMVQMDNYRSLLPADENGFIPVNNVTFQNILVRNLKYGLFSTQRARYIIDYLTIDNCILYADSQIDFLDFTNGGVLQELNIINSTLANRGAGLAQIYNAENSNNPVDADVKVQKLNINNSTLSKVKGFTHPAASTAELQIKVLNNVVAASPNFCVSLNGDQNTVVQFNAFANPVARTMIEDDEVWVGKDYRLSEPLATGSIEGDVIFLNNFDNQVDFSLGECAAKEAEVGDPRWLIARMYVTLGLIEYAKRDLSWIVNEGLKKGFNMFILPEPADDDPYLYLKTLKSINVDKPLYIKSNPKIRVFAGLNADPFIVLSDEPAVKKINDYWRLNLIRLRGLWVICMRNSIIWDNKQKYCVENLKIDDCVLSMTPLPGDLDGMPERLRTKECKFESHIAFEQGGVKDFSIINSTVCDNKDKAVAKYFIRYNNSARLDRYGYDKDKDFQTMTYKNNTFYGMLNADGQWGNYNGISGQKYSKFDIEKNIWYNCGKDIIRRLSGGRIADGAPVKFYQNTYVNDGEILDESGYDKSETQLNSMPKFKFEVTQVYTPDYFHYDDYTLCTSSEQLFYKTGDPRWVENGGFADGYHWDPKLGMPVADSRTGDTDAIETVEANKADGEWYTIQGVRVDKPTKGLFIHNGRKVVIK
jgi:hypothetical protein